MKKTVIMLILLLLPTFLSAGKPPPPGKTATDKNTVAETAPDEKSAKNSIAYEYEKAPSNARLTLPTEPVVSWTAENTLSIKIIGVGESKPELKILAYYYGGSFPEGSTYKIEQDKDKFYVLYKTKRFGAWKWEYVKNDMIRDFKPSNAKDQSPSKGYDPGVIIWGTIPAPITINNNGKPISVDAPWAFIYNTETGHLIVMVTEPDVTITNTHWGYTVRKVALYAAITTGVGLAVFYAPRIVALATAF